MLPTLTLAQSAHVHLLLNHFPTVAFSIAVGLLLVSFFRKSDDLKRASFVIFVIIALLSIPVYITGKAAQEAIAGMSGVSEMSLERHQDAALLGLVFMQITGALAWLGLWQFRRFSRIVVWNSIATLLAGLLTFALMARAANIGGEIRHPEIAVGTSADSNTEWLKSASLASLINDTEWAWAAMETIHFVGLSLLFGCVLAVSLRALGVMKVVPFSAFHRLLPWGVLGFGLNLISGLLFFIAIPTLYTQAIAMPWKMGSMMLAGFTVLYFTMFDEPWALGSGVEATLTVKVMGAFNIALWVVVIYFGRMIPYIGNL
jgi:uncharacterized membrane protein